MAGIEPICGGYQTFRVAPKPGGGITFAHASIRTPYGKSAVDWKIEGNQFFIHVIVPVSAICHLELPNGEEKELKSGEYHLQVMLRDEKSVTN